MANQYYDILLADDDPDDCMFFKDALSELALDAALNTVNNGVELMHFLESQTIKQFPDVLFLDLNMPRKSGLECLSELKQNETLKQIPVIIYSTSSNPAMMQLLYDKGAQYYIRKPADFTNLKSVIYKALCLSNQNKMVQPPKESFMIQP
jgi:CheY-like chemotaxis protein